MSVSPDLKEVWSACRDILISEQIGGEERLGISPASGLERELQALLDEAQGVANS